ncbi:MAG: biopolymer transporter ExbD [candidate division KSB1 bacterium]|nr:biopolymer transporter ExbD [candidate division KSB1 bacterium]
MLNLGSNKFSLVARVSRRNHGDLRLRLTSMIDMFTILLVFLLKSYSAEGQIITLSKDLRLPDSTAEKPPISSPIIMATQEWLLLDDEQIVPIDEIVNGKSLTIRPLQAKLAEKKAIAERLGQMDPLLGFKGNITIQGDKEIPFKILKKIMFTCGQVGYNNILLAVNKQE